MSAILGKNIQKRIGVSLLVLLLLLMMACGSPAATPDVQPTATPVETPAPVVDESVPPPAGEWKNEADETTLTIMNGKYIVTEPEILRITAGDCSMQDGNIRLGEISGTIAEDKTIELEGLGTFALVTLLSDNSGTPGALFLGEWENDTTQYKLSITQDQVLFYNHSGSSGGNYTQDDQGLMTGDSRIVFTEGGGLTADGYEGTFYRVGEGKGAPSIFIPFMGVWRNATTGSDLQVKDGTFMYAEGNSVGGGGCSINGDTLLFSSYIARINESGALVVDGVEGVFEKDEEASATLSEEQSEEPPAQTDAFPFKAPPTGYDGVYGLVSSSADMVEFIEPLTGASITLPGVFDGSIMDVMQTQNGDAYLFVVSPDSRENFNLFSSEIEATASVQVANIKAHTISDAIKYFYDRHDAFQVLYQQNNYVVLVEDKTTDGVGDIDYKFVYLYDNGSVLNVQLTADSSVIQEYAYEIYIQMEAMPPQSGAMLLPDGDVEYSDEEELLGFAVVVGAWYNEEADAALHIYGDGTAKLMHNNETKECGVTLFYNGSGYASIELFEGVEANGLLASSALQIDGMAGIFTYMNAEELPAHLQP